MLNTPLPYTELGRSSPPNGHAFVHWSAKLVDSAIIVMLLVGPTFVRSQDWPLRYTIALMLALMVFHVIAELATLYRPWRGEAITRQFFRILIVWAGTVFVLLLAGYMLKQSAGFSRVALGTWFFATPALMIAWRALGRIAASRLLETERARRFALVYGEGELADRLAQTIQESDRLGLQLVDQMSPDTPADPASTSPNTPKRSAPQPPPLTQAQLCELRARRGDFSILYIVLGSVPKPEAVDIVERISDTTVSVYMVPDYFENHLFHGQWSSLGGIPLVSVYETPFWGADGWLKRLQDVVLGIPHSADSRGADDADRTGREAVITRPGLFSPAALRRRRQ